MVRTKPDGRLGFVCDFQEDVIGDLDDPSCVRSVKLYEPPKPCDDWETGDYFIVDLDEVEEASGFERDHVCANFDHAVISNYWTEDTPPERHYFIWLDAGDTGAEIWLRRGFGTDLEHLATLGPGKLMQVRRAFDQAGIQRWRRSYTHNGWYIGGNAWGFELICGNRKLTTGGDDNYPAALEELCGALRSAGIPVRFREGQGLVYDPPRQRRRRKSRG